MKIDFTGCATYEVSRSKFTFSVSGTNTVALKNAVSVKKPSSSVYVSVTDLCAYVGPMKSGVNIRSDEEVPDQYAVTGSNIDGPFIVSPDAKYVIDSEGVSRRSTKDLLDLFFLRQLPALDLPRLTHYETAESKYEVDKDKMSATYELELFGYNNEEELDEEVKTLSEIYKLIEADYSNIKFMTFSPFKGKSLYGVKVVALVF